MTGYSVILKELPPAKWKTLESEISSILIQFEKAQEWADLAICLQKLSKTIVRHEEAHMPVPNMLSICKVLSKCLNPHLPSGIHSKTLKVYDCILDRVGPAGSFVWLQYLLPPLITLYGYASNSNRLQIANLYQEYLVPCLDELSPLSTMILMGIALGAEDEKAPEYSTISSFLMTCEKAWTRPVTFRTYWTIVAQQEEYRLATLKIMTRRLEQHDDSSLDDMFMWESEIIDASRFCYLPPSNHQSERHHQNHLKCARLFLDIISRRSLVASQQLIANVTPLLAFGDQALLRRLQRLDVQIFVESINAIIEGQDTELSDRWSKQFVTDLRFKTAVYNNALKVASDMPDGSDAGEDDSPRTKLTPSQLQAWPLYASLSKVPKSYWSHVIQEMPSLDTLTEADHGIWLSNLEQSLRIAGELLTFTLDASTEFHPMFPVDLGTKMLLIAGLSSGMVSEDMLAAGESPWMTLLHYIEEHKTSSVVQAVLDEAILHVNHPEGPWPIIVIADHPPEEYLQRAVLIAGLGSRSIFQQLLDTDSSMWIAATGYTCLPGTECPARFASPAHSPNAEEPSNGMCAKQSCRCALTKLSAPIIRCWSLGKDLPMLAFAEAHLEALVDSAIDYVSLTPHSDAHTLLHNTVWAHGIHKLEDYMVTLSQLTEAGTSEHSTRHGRKSFTLFTRKRAPAMASPEPSSPSVVDLDAVQESVMKLTEKLCTLTLTLKHIPMVLSNTHMLAYLLPYTANNCLQNDPEASANAIKRVGEIIRAIPEHIIQVLWGYPPPLLDNATDLGQSWSCLHAVLRVLLTQCLPQATKRAEESSDQIVAEIVGIVHHVGINTVCGELAALYLESLSSVALKLAQNGNQYALASVVLNCVLHLLMNTNHVEAPISFITVELIKTHPKLVSPVATFLAGSRFNSCEQTRVEETYRLLQPVFNVLFGLLDCTSGSSVELSDAEEPKEAAPPCKLTRTASAILVAHSRELVAMIPALKILTLLSEKSPAVRASFARYLVRTLTTHAGGTSGMARLQRNFIVHLNNLAEKDIMLMSSDRLIQKSMYEESAALEYMSSKHGPHESITKHMQDIEAISLGCLTPQFFSVTSDRRLHRCREQYLINMCRLYERSTFLTICSVWASQAVTGPADHNSKVLFDSVRQCYSLERLWELAASTDIHEVSKSSAALGFLHAYTTYHATLDTRVDTAVSSKPLRAPITLSKSTGIDLMPIKTEMVLKSSENLMKSADAAELGSKQSKRSMILWKHLEQLTTTTPETIPWTCELAFDLATHHAVTSPTNYEKLVKSWIDACLLVTQPPKKSNYSFDLIPPYAPSLMTYELDLYKSLGCVDQALQAEGEPMRVRRRRSSLYRGYVLGRVVHYDVNGPHSVSASWLYDNAECAIQICVHSFGALVENLVLHRASPTSTEASRAVVNTLLTVIMSNANLASLLVSIINLSLAKQPNKTAVYSLTRTFLCLALYAIDYIFTTNAGTLSFQSKTLAACNLFVTKALRPIRDAPGNRLRKQWQLAGLIQCLNCISRSHGTYLRHYVSVLNERGAGDTWLEQAALSLIAQTWTNTVGSVVEAEPLVVPSIFSSRATDLRNRSDYLNRLAVVAVRMPESLLLVEEQVWCGMITEMRKCVEDTEYTAAALRLRQSVLYLLRALLMRVGPRLPANSPMWPLINAEIAHCWLPLLSPVLYSGAARPLPAEELRGTMDVLFVRALQIVEVAAVQQLVLAEAYIAQGGLLDVFLECYAPDREVAVGGEPSGVVAPASMAVACGQTIDAAQPDGVNAAQSLLRRFRTRRCRPGCVRCLDALLAALENDPLSTKAPLYAIQN